MFVLNNGIKKIVFRGVHNNFFLEYNSHFCSLHKIELTNLNNYAKFIMEWSCYFD